MKKIAILVESKYEDMELQYPLFRLREEGFQVDLVGTEKGVTYEGKHGYPAKSDLASKEVNANNYDAVVIPGGWSPDYMRRCQDTKNFVKEMDKQSKIIAAICHSPWMMTSCCNLKGKKVTSYSAIKDDLTNAGAEFMDKAVVVDGHLITSRTPADLVLFTKAIIQKLKN